MHKISTVLLGMLQITQLHAALYLNDQKTLEVPIPRRGLTRLSVQDDVIQDIFVYPQMIESTPVQDSLQLHKSGHVFIAPDTLSQSFYLTVMTQKGKVQDLKIMPGSQGNGPVILKLPAPQADPQEVRQKHQKRMEAALMAAVQGFAPPGFQSISLEGRSESEEQGDIQKTCIGAYTQKAYRIDVYTLENKGDREIFLSPSLFLGPSDLAVVFDQPSLTSGGQVCMAILRKVAPRTPSSQAPLSLTQNQQG